MNSLTKLKKKWRKELTEWFDRQEIYYCERCGRTDTKLDISHGKKQRFLLTRELYFFAARLCRSCHYWAEYGTGDEPGTHERLERIHLDIIKRRKPAQEYIRI
jgi:hypothetical protein